LCRSSTCALLLFVLMPRWIKKIYVEKLYHVCAIKLNVPIRNHCKFQH
jgi:hypothetical protein